MQLSAELRWFRAMDPNLPVVEWFRSATVHGCAPGGGEPRTDVYIVDAKQIELGVKRRGINAGLEVKGLIGSGGIEVAPGVRPQLWCKWIAHTLDFGAAKSLTTVKTRYLRKYSVTHSGSIEQVQLNRHEKPQDPNCVLPERGCNVELTDVLLVEGGRWLTLGFESFGTTETVQEDVAALFLLYTLKRLPLEGQWKFLSYPEWIATVFAP